MTNAEIAETLETLADLLEFQGANSFRTRAYRNGARAIRNLTESVQSIIEDPTRKITDLDGIGKSVGEKCAVLVETGQLPQLQELLEKVPATVLDMLRIPGLGPKKAAVLFNDLHIQDLEQLRAACLEEKIRELKGFAAKTEEAILKGIDEAASANRRMFWADADQIVTALKEHFAKIDVIDKLEIAGSYRRGRETVGDLDVLAVSKEVEKVMDHFGTYVGIADVLVRGGTKMAIRLHTGLQIDLRVVPEESFGAALQYFTGSKEHNVVLRGLARQHGLKINEYGVFKMDGENEEYIAGASEEDVYATLNLPVFPPELRENRGEFDLVENNAALPELIQLSDIVGDLHMHTTSTDGEGTIEEMAAAARVRGLKYIAITDHSQRWMGRGMNSETLLAQWKEIDEINARAEDDFLILKGIECDILEKGGLDLPDEILAQGDWVLASIHYGQQQPREQINERMLEALESAHVDAIAHPTGRLVNKRKPYDLDVDMLLKKAKEHGKILELNAHPARLDLNEIYSAGARRLGVPIVINTDAHSMRGLDVMRYGILQARRAGLTPSDVVNTRDWAYIEALKAEG
ncbi:MAG: DNA polymerase (family 10) [Pirellulaceae bacterium]|jgi:DNA polymerase (family 10)